MSVETMIGTVDKHRPAVWQFAFWGLVVASGVGLAAVLLYTGGSFTLLAAIALTFFACLLVSGVARVLMWVPRRRLERKLRSLHPDASVLIIDATSGFLGVTSATHPIFAAGAKAVTIGVGGVEAWSGQLRRVRVVAATEVLSVSFLTARSILLTTRGQGFVLSPLQFGLGEYYPTTARQTQDLVRGIAKHLGVPG